MDFRDRTAVVTGAARGIGRAICLELAHKGCNIAFNYWRSKEQADQLVLKLREMGRLAYCQSGNVADLNFVSDMVKEVIERFGRIDYLVNNAGIVKDKLVLRMSECDWDEVVNTNLKGAFNFSKAVTAFMIKAKFGSILNITSISGIIGMAGQANYSASKAGMIGLTKAMARELASRNITVNALALGFIKTDMIQALTENYRASIMKTIPIGRFGTPEEAARVAVFLLSDNARYITGQVLRADGGLAM